MIDVRAAVEHARERMERASYLPFITDHEMADLFGDEVGGTLSLLDHCNEEKGTCRECAGLCCRQMRCELYAVEFGRCPVSPLRPVLCRFNFCYRFGKENAQLARDLIAVAVDTVAAVPADSPAAGAFTLNALLYGECRGEDEPPPAAAMPLRAIVASARLGMTTWPLAASALLAEVRAYRVRAGATT